MNTKAKSAGRGVKSQVGSYPARPKVGDSVRLLYDPAHPQEAEVDSASAKWFVPTAWVFLGIVTLIIGAMFWYLAA
ncbi:MAG: DUF3592 domain-containing protein [Anaerolineales bacterium]|nr:DUF3592 domain-containing protein [Anaerolineales bacterium]